MHQNSTLFNSLLHKRNRGWKVTNQRAVRRVRNTDDLVDEIFGEAGLAPVGHLEDVRDASLFEGPQILGSLKIA